MWKSGTIRLDGLFTGIEVRVDLLIKCGIRIILFLKHFLYLSAGAGYRLIINIKLKNHQNNFQLLRRNHVGPSLEHSHQQVKQHNLLVTLCNLDVN